MGNLDKDVVLIHRLRDGVPACLRVVDLLVVIHHYGTVFLLVGLGLVVKPFCLLTYELTQLCVDVLAFVFSGN
jgi:hypothetical protein